MKTKTAWHSGHELSEERIASLCRRSSEEMGIRPTVELAAAALAWHIDADILQTALTHGVDRDALRRAVCEQMAPLGSGLG
jgi:hypothetical protein